MSCPIISLSSARESTGKRIKTREGRPIKVENNKEAKTNGNGNARVQASVLSLYDSTRLQGPLANGEPVEWSALDASVTNKLEGLKESEKQIVLLTHHRHMPAHLLQN